MRGAGAFQAELSKESEYKILRELCKAQYGIGFNELSRRTRLSKRTVQKAIQRLNARPEHLVEKSYDNREEISALLKTIKYSDLYRKPSQSLLRKIKTRQKRLLNYIDNDDGDIQVYRRGMQAINELIRTRVIKKRPCSKLKRARALMAKPKLVYRLRRPLAHIVDE